MLAPRRLLVCLAVATAASACSSPPAAPDAATDAVDPDAVADASSDVVTVDTAPFATADHVPLPQVPDHGGAVIAHPQLVVITYADDPNRAGIEADARWMVGSSWLATVGGEYGVGDGTVLATIERTDNAPTTIDDDAIQALIASGLADGSLPGATAGAAEETQPIYIMYFPQQTTVTESASGRVVGTSCRDFGGYHSEVSRGGYTVPYAVINTCSGFTDPYVGIQSIEGIASHELFEAATDPAPRHPAYTMNSLIPSSPWTVATEGGELGDMCILWPNWVVVEGHLVQRMWSNRAAMTGTEDPCVPAPATTPFYLTSATPDDIEAVNAGESVTYTLQGWSSAPVNDWTLSALSWGSQFMPTIALGATTLNNGGTTTLTVTVPATATSGQYASVLVYSSRSRTDYAIVPITVVVN